MLLPALDSLLRSLNIMVLLYLLFNTQISLTFDVLLLAAIKAVEVGVAGIVVSNHGARQLDYTPATIAILEEVRFDLYCLA